MTTTMIPLIPREEMPQIDVQDLRYFQDWLIRNGIGYCKGLTSPERFSPRQPIDEHIVRTIEEHHLDEKPILVSIDNFILDGNHRWKDHIEHRTKVIFIQIPFIFEEAIQVMFEFPKTYRLGDGQEHPNREDAL